MMTFGNTSIVEIQDKVFWRWFKNCNYREYDREYVCKNCGKVIYIVKRHVRIGGYRKELIDAVGVHMSSCLGVLEKIEISIPKIRMIRV